MKFNWGTGIAIVIIIFFILIFSFVYFTTTFKINLVEKDYYPKELNYDEQITKEQNTDNLSKKIVIDTYGEIITITFPQIAEKVKPEGTIHFYRPSDYEKDIIIAIELDENFKQSIDVSSLLPGKYIIKMDWTLEGIPYYQEEIFIH